MRVNSFKVIHCAETIKGGVATYLREILPLQLEKFGERSVAVLVPKSHLNSIPFVNGITYLTFDDSGRRSGNSWSLLKALNKFLKEESVDIVHIHSSYAGLLLRPFLYFFYSSAKVIYCPHGWGWDRDSSPLVKRLVRLAELFLSKFCDAIICISEHEKNSAVEVGIKKEKLILILNGISDKPVPRMETQEASSNKLKVLFVGRFDQQKGVDIFCDSLFHLSEYADGVMVGDNVISKEKIEVPGNVLIKGWLNEDELHEIMLSSDVLVMPSRWEGFGLVSLEAMRSELPVIASNVGGLREIVVDDVTGFLVPVGDYQAIVDVITSTDKKKLKDMGATGRQRFLDLFEAKRMHQEIYNLYEKLVK